MTRMKQLVTMMARHIRWESSGRKSILGPSALVPATEDSRAGVVTIAADLVLLKVLLVKPIRRESNRAQTRRTSIVQLNASIPYIYIQMHRTDEEINYQDFSIKQEEVAAKTITVNAARKKQILPCGDESL